MYWHCLKACPLMNLVSVYSLRFSPITKARRAVGSKTLFTKSVEVNTEVSDCPNEVAFLFGDRIASTETIGRKLKCLRPILVILRGCLQSVQKQETETRLFSWKNIYALKFCGPYQFVHKAMICWNHRERDDDFGTVSRIKISVVCHHSFDNHKNQTLLTVPVNVVEVWLVK